MPGSMPMIETDAVRALVDIGFIALSRGLDRHAEAIFDGVTAARPDGEAGPLGMALVALLRSDATVDCQAAAAAVTAASKPDATRGYALAVLAACQHRGGAAATAATTLAEALQLLRRHRDERFPERRYAESLATLMR